MTPFLQDADCTLYHGDAYDVLRRMEPESVDCVVTSPPYWGLRDYGNEGQLGLEETPDLFVARMVAVFREVRRVLAPHGTCWVNLGDSYAATLTSDRHFTQPTGPDGTPATKHPPQFGGQRTAVAGLKPKDLVGIPWRVAFALQADGWWLRSDIVWAKPNPMPESVTDRPTKAHEYVFLLAKQSKYFFDQEAVREKYLDGPGLNGGAYSPPGQSPHGNARGPDGRQATRVLGQDGSEQHRDGERWPNPTGRNVRSVWTIATQPYPEAHFATYPEELVRRCVLAGCPERVCRTCGKASERLTEAVEPERRPLSSRTGIAHVPGNVPLKDGSVGASRFRPVGWSDCGHNDWRPGLVLDPFVGSGTTCLVARNHGRHSVGIDLNQEYLALAATRLQQLSLLTGEAHASQ